MTGVAGRTDPGYQGKTGFQLHHEDKGVFETQGITQRPLLVLTCQELKFNEDNTPVQTGTRSDSSRMKVWVIPQDQYP